jgi:hypothetical protein
VSIRNLGVGISFKGGNEGDPVYVEGGPEVTELGAVGAPRESEESVSVSVGEERLDMATVGEGQVGVEVGGNEGQEQGAQGFLARPCPVMTLVQRHEENSWLLLVDEKFSLIFRSIKSDGW